MTDKMREAYKMHRAKLAGQLIQGEDWAGAYRRAEELLSWSCFEAGWKASREALVIELPQSLMPVEVDHHSELPLMHAGAVFAAIEAAGLKVKS